MKKKKKYKSSAKFIPRKNAASACRAALRRQTIVWRQPVPDSFSAMS